MIPPYDFARRNIICANTVLRIESWSVSELEVCLLFRTRGTNYLRLSIIYRLNSGIALTVLLLGCLEARRSRKLQSRWVTPAAVLKTWARMSFWENWSAQSIFRSRATSGIRCCHTNSIRRCPGRLVFHCISERWMLVCSIPNHRRFVVVKIMERSKKPSNLYSRNSLSTMKQRAIFPSLSGSLCR